MIFASMSQFAFAVTFGSVTAFHLKNMLFYFLSSSYFAQLPVSFLTYSCVLHKFSEIGPADVMRAHWRSIEGFHIDVVFGPEMHNPSGMNSGRHLFLSLLNSSSLSFVLLAFPFR